MGKPHNMRLLEVLRSLPKGSRYDEAEGCVKRLLPENLSRMSCLQSSITDMWSNVVALYQPCSVAADCLSHSRACFPTCLPLPFVVGAQLMVIGMLGYTHTVCPRRSSSL